MQIFRGFDSLPPFQRAVATVGSYDGVHAGHRSLLQRTREEALRIGAESVVFTFDPHPRLALDPECEMRLLTSLDEKIRLIEAEGIDHLVILPFDRAFSRTAPEEFVRLLVERAHVECLVIGYDHRFGRDKSGGMDLLQQLGSLRVIEVAEQEMESEHLSSTAVRRLIEQGEVAHAARLLGHPYRLSARRSTAESWQSSDPWKMLPKVGAYPVKNEAGQPYRLQIDSSGELRFDPQPDCEEGLFTFV